MFAHQKMVIHDDAHVDVDADSRAARRKGGFFRCAADAGVREENQKI